jgi:hypothetical protein
MNIISPWSQKARTIYEARSAFNDEAQKSRNIGQLFFGVNRKASCAIGIYIELDIEAPNTIIARSLTYSADLEQIGPTVTSNFISFSRVPDGAQEATFESHIKMGEKNFKIACLATLKSTDENTSIIINASSSLTRIEPNKDQYGYPDKYPPDATLPDLSKNILLADGPIKRFAVGAECFCTDCFGIGAKSSMKIPRKDWESGATGYSLFSCNKANGIEACHTCGGTGGRFLEWYLEENPELRRQPFSPGSGLYRANT